MKHNCEHVDLEKLERISSAYFPPDVNFIEIIDFEKISSGAGYAIKCEGSLAKITEVFYDCDTQWESRIDSPEFVKHFYQTVNDLINLHGLKNIADDAVSTFHFNERITFAAFNFNMNEKFTHASEVILLSVFAGKLYSLRFSFISDIDWDEKSKFIPHFFVS